MSYTPINWQNGDVITADKLNKMDRGWDTAETTLFSETVTTVAEEEDNVGELSYVFTEEPPETLTITFDGVEYQCQKLEIYDAYFYGGFGETGPDFTNYPFFLMLMPNDATELCTETAGTYTISAKAPAVVCSDEFETAVKTVVGGGSGGGVLVVEVDMQTTELDKTWQEIHDADFPVLVGNTPTTKFFTLIDSVVVQSETYEVHATLSGSPAVFRCDSANDYPFMNK